MTGKPHQRVLQLLAGLGPFDHGGRLYGAGIITPALLSFALHVLDDVVAISTNPVDGKLCRMRCSQVTNNAPPRKESARWRTRNMVSFTRSPAS
ncbi:MAG: hypothetical protein ABJA33_07630 [Pedococcus sp.]